MVLNLINISYNLPETMADVSIFLLKKSGIICAFTMQLQYNPLMQAATAKNIAIHSRALTAFNHPKKARSKITWYCI